MSLDNIPLPPRYELILIRLHSWFMQSSLVRNMSAPKVGFIAIVVKQMAKLIFSLAVA